MNRADEISTYIPILHRYFERRWSNQADVDDLVQQVMLRLLSCETTDDIENLRAYVFRTAANVLFDQLRRDVAHGAAFHDEFDADNHGVDEHNPLRIAEARQQIVLAEMALQELPERSRSIFLLRRLENCSYRDIASQFQMSVSAVEKLMVRLAKYMTDVRCEHIQGFWTTTA
ncbi:sigma-70 family RNA polymerase sigma factor (plasmid) [Polymorphobacter sp. PAMC 29334]|uniref:RNA polymerase sigma factor n=1 Tax=Polymorphobacter sp. PAMC 29334 TaxID=2862331 RepID=UPI001C664727|nr:sigma-70 family RNA polymerase sigma factor [Polymorphobacter sp. PAMC 29334]QYE33305.1 sigma-70 family RNA polymerase sigma factor [Polymorphobacter sp. PAMC 29334]